MKNNIGIFYICTGSYKMFFDKFLNSLKNFFKGYEKHLIVISDGLMEYDHKKYGETLVEVEEFIDYAYPFINTNKFNIVEHYAKKYNNDIICYFDAETIILEHDDHIEKLIIDNVKLGKMVSMYAGVFHNESMNIHNFMWGTDVLSPFGLRNGGYCDFSMMNRTVLDAHDYGWIQTSFFACNNITLSYFAEKIKSLINYNNRITQLPLNFTDETWLNYLYQYTDHDRFYIDLFNFVGNSERPAPNAFFKYKYDCPKEKIYIKYGTNNKFAAYVLYNKNSLEYVEKINKFFIEHHSNFIINSFGIETFPVSYKQMEFLTDTPIFKRNLSFWESWWQDNNTKILLHKEFYYDYVIINDSENNIDIATPEVYAFINDINDVSDSFNYDEFFDGNYDYIEGKSFADLENMQYVDFVIFSKRYINAWFSKNNEFIPNVYKLNNV